MTIIECPLRITENGTTSVRPPTAWRKLHSYPAIYGLADPVSGTVRYVGQAKNIGARFVQHLRGQALSTGAPSRARKDWLFGLLHEGRAPLLVLLEFDPRNLDEAEARWLAEVRRQGGGDLNVADVRTAGGPR